MKIRLEMLVNNYKNQLRKLLKTKDVKCYQKMTVMKFFWLFILTKFNVYVFKNNFCSLETSKNHTISIKKMQKNWLSQRKKFSVRMKENSKKCKNEGCIFSSSRSHTYVRVSMLVCNVCIMIKEKGF